MISIPKEILEEFNQKVTNDVEETNENQVPKENSEEE
jgi:hypothetical protein